MNPPEINWAARAAALVAYFEALSPAALNRLEDWYTPDARFKDPFHEVSGVLPIRHIFEQMYKRLESPHFRVGDCIQDGNRCVLTWDFVFRFKNSAEWQTIRGASLIRFDASGRVSEHRDYWDAAEELYEKLPILGRLMRWLKAHAAA